MKKTYIGQRLDTGCEVYVRTEDGKSYPLPDRREIRNHSPTGFEWGYGGSGPAQLALAILADYFGAVASGDQCPYCDGKMEDWKCTVNECGYDGQKENDQWAHIMGDQVHYQSFKSEVIAKLPAKQWDITSDFIDLWARREQQP